MTGADIDVNKYGEGARQTMRRTLAAVSENSVGFYLTMNFSRLRM